MDRARGRTIIKCDMRTDAQIHMRCCGNRADNRGVYSRCVHLRFLQPQAKCVLLAMCCVIFLRCCHLSNLTDKTVQRLLRHSQRGDPSVFQTFLDLWKLVMLL